MLNLKNKQINYTTKEMQYLKSLNLSSGKEWDRSNREILELKKRLKDHLNKQQGYRCAYCSCRLNVGGRAEIEHIAPKGKKLYPEFTFNKYNLVLACQNCNSSSKKGQKDPVLKHSVYYRRCKFSIVHPYLDDPSMHYKWANGVRIIIVSNSPKADASIEMFDLNSQFQTEDRAKTLLADKLKNNMPLNKEEEDQFHLAVGYFD